MSIIINQNDTMIALTSASNPKPLHQIPTFKIIFNPIFPIQAKSDSLLKKRHEAPELEDLMVKKLKTQSTNVSESGSSNQHSPLRSFENNLMQEEIQEPVKLQLAQEDNEDEKYQALGLRSPASAITRASSSSSDESFQQIYNALELLKKKFLEQEEEMQETTTSGVQSTEPLYIPPLLSCVSESNVTNAKRNVAFDQDVSYGDIEYPFLSFSAPFASDNNSDKELALHFLSVLKGVEKPTQAPQKPFKIKKNKSSISMDKTLCKQVLVAVRSESEKSSDEGSIKQVSRKTKIAPKIDTTIKIIRSLNLIQKVENKDKENEREKEMIKEKVQSPEIEAKRSKGKQQREENLYSRPLPSGKRQAERRRNKWQEAQAEKVKDIMTLKPDFNGHYELFVDPNKKKQNETPLGPEYQVDVSGFVLQKKPSNKRMLQPKWDPSSHGEGEMKSFFKNLENLMENTVSQEKSIQILIKNENCVKKAFEYAKANREECFEALVGITESK